MLYLSTLLTIIIIRSSLMKVHCVYVYLPRDPTQFQIMSMAGKIPKSGIWTFINIFVKLCNFSVYYYSCDTLPNLVNRNQQRFDKDSESCQQKSVVLDPLISIHVDIYKVHNLMYSQDISQLYPSTLMACLSY